MGHYGLWLDRYELRRGQILDKWSNLAHIVEEMRPTIPSELVFKKLLEGGETRGKMCFIDGGEGLRELLGLGVYFIRASGLTLCADESGPRGELFIRDLDMNMLDYDDHMKDRVDLLRDGMEYDVAMRCVQEHKPEMLVLDGSLHVKAGRRPVDCLEYELYRKKYSRLLRLCKREGVRIIGVSEDSRSRLFTRHLTDEYGVTFPKHMTDSTILRILSTNGGYMTREFMPKYGQETAGGITGGITKGFRTAYMQPYSLANPLRIDAPDWEEDLTQAVQTIACLCRGSGHYGYPLPLYLAHMDAKISSAQMDWTVKQIVSYISKRDDILADAVMKPTRRCDRPT
ncbi:MAG: DNA double-strand break repair nuclease NurA [Candidatus Altiarchaeota archaeon]